MQTHWRSHDRGLAALSAEMDRLLNHLGPARGAWSYGLAPVADVLETEAEYRVVLDMPGHDPAAIAIEVANDILTVRSDRSQPRPAAGETVHRSERAFGTFFRALELPRTVDGTRVEARYEHGVLTVVLPKRDEAKPRTIAVQVK